MKSKNWKGAGGECIGPLHIKQGLPMQDSHRLYFLRDGFIAAVSDGIGSKKHSDIGSNAACKIFAKCAKKWKKQRKQNFESLLAKFHKAWLKKIKPYAVNDCNATFLGAVCTGENLFLARLGDGMIAVLKQDGSNIILSDLKEDSFSNITNCLGDKFDLSNWQIVKMPCKDIQSIFLCTDGISDDLQKGQEIEFVKELALQYKTMAEKKIECDMNSWLKNWSVPRHSDDKTAVFICRKD